MKKNQLNFKQILPITIICGLVGGILLISTELLISNHLFFKKGWWIILTYSLVLLGTMMSIKAKKKIEIYYLKNLLIGVLTFMIMSFVLYLYISKFENPNSGITLWGHTWRFLAMLGFAITSSAILGLFFIKRNNAGLQKL